MYELAPNIDLLFTEAGESHADRVRAAAASGFTAVEMWGPTGADAPATPKDLPALKAALEETGTQLTAQLAEPRTQFMIPPWDHSEFFRKLDEGVEIAHFLGTPSHGGRQRNRIRRLEAPGAARQAHRDLPEGHRADRRFGHHLGPRAGEHPRRPPGRPARSHVRGRVRRARRRLAVLRRALRPLPLDRRGRGCRGRARERGRPDPVRAARRRARPRRARHRVDRLARPGWATCAPRATTGRSGSSTTRRPRRPSRSSSSSGSRRRHERSHPSPGIPPPSTSPSSAAARPARPTPAS